MYPMNPSESKRVFAGAGAQVRKKRWLQIFCELVGSVHHRIHTEVTNDKHPGTFFKGTKEYDDLNIPQRS